MTKQGNNYLRWMPLMRDGEFQLPANFLWCASQKCSLIQACLYVAVLHLSRTQEGMGLAIDATYKRVG